MTRKREPRIVDPATHPRQYVSVAVAAAYLSVDRKTLGGWLDEGRLPYYAFGTRRRILVSDLVAYLQSLRRAS